MVSLQGDRIGGPLRLGQRQRGFEAVEHGVPEQALDVPPQASASPAAGAVAALIVPEACRPVESAAVPR